MALTRHPCELPQVHTRRPRAFPLQWFGQDANHCSLTLDKAPTSAPHSSAKPLIPPEADCVSHPVFSVHGTM